MRLSRLTPEITPPKAQEYMRPSPLHLPCDGSSRLASNAEKSELTVQNNARGCSTSSEVATSIPTFKAAKNEFMIKSMKEKDSRWETLEEDEAEMEGRINV